MGRHRNVAHVECSHLPSFMKLPLLFGAVALLTCGPLSAQLGIETPAVEVALETAPAPTEAEPPAPPAPPASQAAPEQPVTAASVVAPEQPVTAKPILAPELPLTAAPMVAPEQPVTAAPVTVLEHIAPVPPVKMAPVAEVPVTTEVPEGTEAARPREGRPPRAMAPVDAAPPTDTPVSSAPMPVVTAPEGVVTPGEAPPIEAERPVQAAPSTETVQILAEPEKRDRTADVQAAETIKDDKDASRLIYSILGGAAAGAIAAKVVTGSDRNQGGQDPRYQTRGVPGHDYPVPARLSEAESGRSRREREASVGYMTEQFGGQGHSGGYAPQAGRPPQQGVPGQGPGYGGRPPQQGYPDQPAQYREAPQRSAPTYYEGNRRVVRYSSRSEIPPILIANSHLNRVEVTSSYEANNYRAIGEAPRWANGGERPDAYYQSQDAYAVSYQVDPNSAVSRDDILFRQGSTAFGDAYSYDIVIDMAEAMNQPQLLNQGFIIEGHASAEGSFSSNLHLSQLRAERIAQELVRYGVAPERLLPVGYGESEAAYPGDAPEQYRRLDRRVMIFRME